MGNSSSSADPEEPPAAPKSDEPAAQGDAAAAQPADAHSSAPEAAVKKEAASEAAVEREAAGAAEAAAAAEAAEVTEAARKAEEERQAQEAAAKRETAEAAAAEERRSGEAAEAAGKAEEERLAQAATAKGKADAAEPQEAGGEAQEQRSAQEAATEGVPAEKGELEEFVRLAAAKLRRLRSAHRPATPERLQVWLQRQHCCKVRLVVQPEALAAALVPLLAEQPSLQAAFTPWSQTGQVSAELEPAVAALLPEAAERVRMQLVHCREHLLSLPMRRHGEWLSSQAYCLAKAKPAALVAELAKRSLVTGSERLAYNDELLAAVAAPAPGAPGPGTGGDGSQAVSAWTATVTVPLARGLLGKHQVKALRSSRLKDAKARWVAAARRAAGVPLAAAWVSLSSDAKRKAMKLAVTVEIPRAPADTKSFMADLHRVVVEDVKAHFSLPTFRLCGLCMNASFFGRQGSRLKTLQEVLRCGLEVQSASDVSVTPLPDAAMSEAQIREALQLLACPAPPVTFPFDKGLVKQVIGSGGRGIARLEAATRLRLHVAAEEDPCRLEGWPDGSVEPAGPDLAARLRAIVEAAPTALEREVDRLKAASHIMVPSAGFPLERTFSMEYTSMKEDRAAARATARAKRAEQRGSRRGDRAVGPDAADSRRQLVARINEFKRQAVEHAKSLHEQLSQDTSEWTDAEKEGFMVELEEQRGELETVAAELFALLQEEWVPAVRWSDEQTAESVLSELQELLEPKRLAELPLTKAAVGDLLARAKSSPVWPKLTRALREERQQARQPRSRKQQEVLVHVRKGKPTLKAVERGGRNKPSEAAAAHGNDVEMEGAEGSGAESPEASDDGGPGGTPEEAAGGAGGAAAEAVGEAAGDPASGEASSSTETKKPAAEAAEQ